MLQVVQVRTFLSDIELPDRNMIREENEVKLIVVAAPKRFNAPPKDRQRLIVIANYYFKEFMNKEPFEVASAMFHYDIFTTRDLHVIEIYRIVLSAVESFKSHIFSKNIPDLQNEAFPLDPPDVIRTKIAPEMKKINEPYMPILQN
jgi:hypothetical protein